MFIARTSLSLALALLPRASSRDYRGCCSYPRLGSHLDGLFTSMRFLEKKCPGYEEEPPHALPNQIRSVTRTVLFVDKVRALASAQTPALAESAENAPAVSAVAEKCG
ncbi:uncharacterized protein EV420DRAFT_1749585 [Desarmillaria tabescens]|uniref:Secreted protein n=1 Tax=Armillaria tabescens TaxID=1929756 RepID=A0AA39N1K3_ARMTA|nr:uncharacterized protein EV420DRAFT_1749585 [Desarmillaria tabescens]KAK0454024.1 hypothetical protein EV420DRAFT_1749585 [Desarmillaria tabescens]